MIGSQKYARGGYSITCKYPPPTHKKTLYLACDVDRGVIQNLFLACENTLVMQYIIPENIFDIPDIWVWSNIDGSGPIWH